MTTVLSSEFSRHFTHTYTHNRFTAIIQVKPEPDDFVGAKFYGLLALADGNYTMSQKQDATLTMAITLSVLGGFAKFLHCYKEQ